MAGVDVVFHHAAHRAVLQSVENPLSTDLANTHGTLLVLKAASDAGVRRVVAASSSSVYGGAKQLPTPESAPLIPRSPYAVSKLAGEHYCRVWAELFGLETVALRYFNVYGPRQRPTPPTPPSSRFSPPRCAPERGRSCTATGSRAAVSPISTTSWQANLAAATAPAGVVLRQGLQHRREYERTPCWNSSTSSARSSASKADPEYTAPRAGDIRHSSADLSAAARDLDWEPKVGMAEGLRRTVDWFANRTRRIRAQPAPFGTKATNRGKAAA